MVCVITFKKDGTVHMLISSAEVSKAYCYINHEYDWEIYSIQTAKDLGLD